MYAMLYNNSLPSVSNANSFLSITNFKRYNHLLNQILIEYIASPAVHTRTSKKIFLLKRALSHIQRSEVLIKLKKVHIWHSIAIALSHIKYITSAAWKYHIG